MQTKTNNILISRLSSYFLIVSAVIFIAVQGFAIVKHVQLQTRMTTPDYINVAKLVIALSAIVITIRSLGRDKGAQVTKLPDPPLRASSSLAATLGQIRAISIRHPVLTPILILSFLIIPVGLCALGKRHGWNDFGIRDWIVVGLAEVPIIALAIFSVVVSWKQTNNNG
jgi:hypothetical protein